MFAGAVGDADVPSRFSECYARCGRRTARFRSRGEAPKRSGSARLNLCNAGCSVKDLRGNCTPIFGASVRTNRNVVPQWSSRLSGSDCTCGRQRVVRQHNAAFVVFRGRRTKKAVTVQ
jgi:hypothetical protein